MSDRKTKFCSNCGAEIDTRAEICPKCGARVAPPPTSFPPTIMAERKNEGLAAVLSFLFFGLGQIYNGQIGKGILFIVVGSGCCAINANSDRFPLVPAVLDLQYL